MLNIIYEDNHIIVVEKPVNIPSQADKTGDVDMITMIKDYLKEKYNKPGNVYLGLVHRLDRPVSGVMVFAKTSKAAARLSDQVRTHSLKKKYMAIVYDNGLKDEDKFVDYLYKDNNNSSVVVDSKKGKYAELCYKVLERDNKSNLALVDIELVTGRHHQIRVQFASRNHPLFGDQRYGVQDRNQIALHAYKLEFVHPTTKERLVFISKPLNKSKWSNFKI